jgi:hypothetical protein
VVAIRRSWDESRAGRDLLVVDGLTVTKMGNEGGDYATVLGNLCLASGQHAWNVYVNHVEDSNLFIGELRGPYCNPCSTQWCAFTGGARCVRVRVHG